jgi:hypothetical protein
VEWTYDIIDDQSNNDSSFLSSFSKGTSDKVLDADMRIEGNQ